MEFNLAEKLAIVHMVHSVILVDGIVHNGEINMMSKLMETIGFDSNFIVSARNIDTGQSLSILKGMTHAKKKNLATILEEVANADGFFHEKEKTLLLSVFTSMEIGREL